MDKQDKVAFITNSIISAIIGSIITFYCDFFLNVKPQITKLECKIDTLQNNLLILKKGSEVVEKHMLQRPTNGMNCKVGRNAYLQGNIASVSANNILGLKKQDCIWLTYEKGLKTVGILVVIDVLDNKNNSDADIFLSKESFEKLGIEKKDIYNKGVFNMNYKYIYEDK